MFSKKVQCSHRRNEMKTGSFICPTLSYVFDEDVLIC